MVFSQSNLRNDKELKTLKWHTRVENYWHSVLVLRIYQLNEPALAASSTGNKSLSLLVFATAVIKTSDYLVCGSEYIDRGHWSLKSQDPREETNFTGVLSLILSWKSVIFLLMIFCRFLDLVVNSFVLLFFFSQLLFIKHLQGFVLYELLVGTLNLT